MSAAGGDEGQLSPGSGGNGPSATVRPETLRRLHELGGSFDEQDAGRAMLDENGAEIVLDGEDSAAGWLARAVELLERDKVAEVAKARATKWSLGLAVAGAFLLFGLPPLGAVVLLAALVVFFQRRKHDKVDLEDRRLLVFARTLECLAADLRPNKPVVAKVDFTSYKKHSVPGGYQQQWLHLVLPLRDGSSVTTQVTLRIKERKKRKRKYTKIKTQQLEQIAVRVVAPRGRAFRSLERAAAARGRKVGRLLLARATPGDRHCLFVWRTAGSRHVYGRGGWSHRGAPTLRAKDLIGAIMTSYKLAASGGAE